MVASVADFTLVGGNILLRLLALLICMFSPPVDLESMSLGERLTVNVAPILQSEQSLFFGLFPRTPLLLVLLSHVFVEVFLPDE